MKRWFLLLALTLVLPTSPAVAEEPTPILAEHCPASVQLNMQERDAVVRFNSRLSGLWAHYGKDSFEPKLRELLRNHDAGAKVIEISPLFLEKITTLIDVYRLRNAIERTIGLDNKKWDEFERTMWSVVMHNSIYSRKHRIFEKKVESLMVDIRKSIYGENPINKQPKDRREAYIQEAITRVASMYISIQRLDSINRQAIDERAEDLARQMAVIAIGLVTGAVVVSGTVYGPGIVIAAGAYAGGFSSSAGISLMLTGLGEVVAGAGLGIVGAPVGQLAIDNVSNHLGASAASKSLRTRYSCELGKKFKEMRERGIDPYLEMAIKGGLTGAVGGGVTFAGKTVARAVLLASSFGVGIAQFYTVGQLSEYTLESLAEYRLALDEMDKGNREEAVKHLHKSREYATLAGERGMQTIIVSVLSISIASEFKGAIIQGGSAIRAIFANSADTLPLSMQIAQEAVESIAVAH